MKFLVIVCVIFELVAVTLCAFQVLLPAVVSDVDESVIIRLPRSPRRGGGGFGRYPGYGGVSGSQAIASAQAQSLNLGPFGGASAASGGGAASSFGPGGSSFSNALSQSYSINGLGLSHSGSLGLSNAYG